MEIYFIFIFILFVCSLFEVFDLILVQRQRNRLLLFVYCLAVVLIGTRWETGTDWNNYLRMYEESYSLRNSFAFSTFVEFGYLILNWACYYIYPNYSFFLFVHALIYYYLIIYGLRKITKYPITTFLFIFCSTIGVLGSNRQLLAIALIFYFISLAIEKKRVFFLIILAAMQFHTTALLTASFYFINRRIRVINILIILIIAGLIGLTDLPGKIFEFVGGGLGEGASYRTEVYSSGEVDEELSLIGLFRRISYVILFLVLRNKIEVKWKYFNFFLNGYLLGIILYLAFANSLIILVNRGSLYFNILEGILFTSVFLILRKNDSKFLYLIFLVFLSILLFFQSISPYPDLFDPYKSLWYNTNYYRYMY